MYELGGAKQAGSTYAHAGPAGKRGRSLRAHRNFPSLPLRFGSNAELGHKSKAALGPLNPLP